MRSIKVVKELSPTTFETDFGVLEWQFAPEGAPTEYILQNVQTGEVYEIIESIVEDSEDGSVRLLGYTIK